MSELRYNINDLYNQLFDTLVALRDERNPMDIERAKVVQQTAQSIVNAGRLECYYVGTVGGDCTGFIPVADEERPPAVSGPGLKLLRGTPRGG